MCCHNLKDTLCNLQLDTGGPDKVPGDRSYSFRLKRSFPQPRPEMCGLYSKTSTHSLMAMSSETAGNSVK